ncbi:thermonuclease family protein [Salibacterium qingdaonense]|uniref:Micrococcal nuclease n=1 Tax=Salibacterium qingdaonense TaxID=266892 RepID=A0A1I4KNF8_9BACI|nr:thermonuclease family protein [Salibacterium qingdaonense]SFL80285.1 micrococcal nuclease [Salibacterium qingdaonense]
MKHYVYLLFVVLLNACGHPAYEEGEKIDAEVIDVVDGDTVTVDMEKGGEETLRLLLIDTPETVHPDEPVQPYGPKASEYAKELLPEGKDVTVEIDTTIRDDYDRFLAYLWVDGKMVNKTMVEQGLARVAYIIEPNTRYVERLQKAEQQAQQQNLGIWSEDGYVTGDGFQPAAVQHAACDNPHIKGNHSSSGDYIYHTPASPNYEQTKAEEMFCSTEAAEEAGYRAIQRP